MKLKEQFENVEIMFEGQICKLKYDELCEAPNECVKISNEYAILFAQFIAENHYVLVNKIGKIYYWKNEYGLKTTVQLMQDYEKQPE